MEHQQPFDIFWGAYHVQKVSERCFAPVLILNAYTAEDEDMAADDRQGVVHDGLWFCNSEMMQQHRINRGDADIQQRLEDDFADGDCYVLCINWVQTLHPCQLHGTVDFTFGSSVAPKGRHIRIVGVATMCMDSHRVVQYDSGMRDWSAVLSSMPEDILDRLSPTPTIPFLTAFEPEVAPTVPPAHAFAHLANGSTKLHAGWQPGLLCAFEFELPDDNSDSFTTAFAWSRNCNIIAGQVDAFHVHTPELLATKNNVLAEQLRRMYWERDVCLGHQSLIPTFLPITGGVPAQDIRRLIYVVDFQLLPFLISLPVADVYTFGVLEGLGGALHRVRSPPVSRVMQSARELLLLTSDLVLAARSQLQLEMEHAVVGKQVRLRYLTFSYSCTVAYFLALPVSASGMEWAQGDDQLTLITQKGFSASDFAQNVISLNWDMDAERAGKRGKAAASFRTVYSRAQDDQRPRAKPTSMRYCLETSRLTVRIAVAQLNGAFQHIKESAQLPLPPPLPAGVTFKRKWSPHLQMWVPRSQPDPPRSVAVQIFRHDPWVWWG